MSLVIDNQGNDLTAVLSHETINQHAQKINKQTLQQLIQHARPQVQALVEEAEMRVKPQQSHLIEQAKTVMMTEAKEDIERLRKLAEVNPNIREEEIHQLEENTTALASYLDHARLKLDAIRVILVTA